MASTNFLASVAKGITPRDALPLHGNKGGLDELVVPDPAKQIRVDRVSGVNPEF